MRTLIISILLGMWGIAVAQALTVKSAAFGNNAPIPREYTGEGADISPTLDWAGAPATTKEFALICDDPDAPAPQPWVHWVLYKIPATVHTLPKDTEGIGVQGKNSFGKMGYNGPMPPPGHGWHYYMFRVYALDAPLQIAAGATKDQLLQAMKGHIVAEGQWAGRYQR